MNMDNKHIIGLYDGGMTCKEIALKYNSTIKTISKILKNNGIKLRKTPHNKIDLSGLNIVEKYKNGMTCKEIASSVGCDIGVISRHIKSSGCDIKSNSERQSKISLIIKNEICDSYISGKSCNELSNIYGISKSHISTILRNNNITRREETRNFLIDDKEHDIICSLYESGKSCGHIADIYGIDYDTPIANILRYRNITIRTPKEATNVISKDNYKFIISAYDNGMSCSYIANKIGCSHKTISAFLRDNSISIRKPKVSSFQQEVTDFILKVDNSFIANDRNVIEPMEIDIYSEKLKIGIECNGDYWHSEKFKHKLYHQNKALECKNQNVRLIQIWEHEWCNDREKIKNFLRSSISSNIKIYARKCRIEKIEKGIAKSFTNNNHIQSHINATVYYGLYYNDKLMQMMSFTKYKDRWEIARLCSESGVIVVGGSSKLYNHFIRQHRPLRIITYCDLDKFSGKVYKSMGMGDGELTQPSYYWHKPHEGILSRQQCMKHKLVKLGYDPSLTESEIMRSRGYNKVYKSGNLRFEKSFTI